MTRPWRIIAAASLCAVWTCAAPVLRADVPPAAAELVRRGADLFARANALGPDRPAEAAAGYAAAAECLESAAASSDRGGKLLYNLGNAYLLAGDVGRAVLNYRRAELALGDEPNLRRNLALARRMRTDRIAPADRWRGLKTLLFWHYDVGRPARMVAFGICYVLVWFLAAWRLVRPRARVGWAICLCAAIVVLAGGSLAAESGWLGGRTEGVIVAAETAARTGDGDQGQAAFDGPLHAGTEFTLVEKRRRWMHVELTDGRRCWIRTRAAGLVGADD